MEIEFEKIVRTFGNSALITYALQQQQKNHSRWQSRNEIRFEALPKFSDFKLPYRAV